MRVVSLVPSATETLLAWGVDVVACTRFCEQPHLRHVGGTKDPDLDAVRALAPDLVVVDREENRREDAEALVDAGLRLHVTHVVDVADVPAMLADLARAVDAAHPVGADLPAATGEWTTAAVLIWRRPWMALGAATYGSTVLGHLGVRNVLVTADGAYPALDLDAIAARSPELVLLPSEPYPFAARHVAEVTAALPRSRPVLLDGRDLFWWGVRTTGALSRLRAALPSPT